MSLERAGERGRTGWDGSVVRSSHVKLVIVAKEKGPIGGVNLRGYRRRLDHVAHRCFNNVFSGTVRSLALLFGFLFCIKINVRFGRWRTEVVKR
jgi:hypothetical protein